MTTYTMIMTCLTGILIFLYVGRIAGTRYYQKRLTACMEQGDLDGFQALAGKRLVKWLIPPFHLHYMRLNIYLLQEDEKKTDEAFEVLLNMKVGRQMRQDVTLKAFHYYVQRKEREKSKKLLEQICTYQNREIAEECRMLFDIYVLGRSNYIDSMLSELPKLPSAQQAVREYLLSVQYQNRGEEQEAKAHEERSAALLREVLAV